MNKLRLLDFDDLLILRYLLQGETLSASARLLGLTQPAVTQRVRKIESVVGIHLLEKHGRHARLTPFGERIARKMRDVLDLLEEVESEPLIEAMELGLGIDEMLMPVSAALMSIRSLQSGLEFNLVAGRPAEFTKSIQSGRMGGAIVPAKGLGKDLKSQLITTIDLVAIVAREQLAGMGSPTEMTFIEYPGISPDLIQPAPGGSINFKGLWRLTSGEMAMRALQSGSFVTLVPKSHFVRQMDLGRYAEYAIPGADAIAPTLIYLEIGADERAWGPFGRLMEALKPTDSPAAPREESRAPLNELPSTVL